MAAFTRFNKIILEVIGGFLLVGLVSVVLLIYRLSSGPVAVEWLGPMLSSAITQELDGGDLQLEEVSLALAPDSGRLVLGIQSIQYVASSNYEIKAERIAFTPDFQSLLIGRFAAIGLAIERVTIFADRAPGLGDTGWLPIFRDFLQAGSGQSDLSLDFLRIDQIDLVHPDVQSATPPSVPLGGQSDKGPASSYISWNRDDTALSLDMRISYATSVRQAQILAQGKIVKGTPGYVEFLIDGFAPRDLAMLIPPLDFLSRQTSPLSIIGTLDVDGAGRPQSIAANMTLGAGAVVVGAREWPVDRMTADIRLNLFDRQLLIHKAQIFAGGENVTFSAEADYTFDQNNRVKGATTRFDIQNLAFRPDRNKDFIFRGRDLSASLTVLRAQQKVLIEKLEGVLGDIPISLGGDVQWANTALETDLNLRIDIRPTHLRSILSIWPPNRSPLTRKWVDTNIKEGSVETGWLAFKGPLSELVKFQKRELARADFLSGDLHFSGLTMRYAKNMPPIEQGVGVMHATGHRLSVDLSDGVVRVGSASTLQLNSVTDNSAANVESDESSVLVGDDADTRPEREAGSDVDLGSDQSWMRIREGFFKGAPFFKANGRADVHFTCAGDLKHIMQTLSREPVRAMRGLPFEAEDLSGTMTAKVQLNVPLKRPEGTPLSVRYDVQAQTSDVDLAKPLENYVLSKGALAVHATLDVVTFSGPVAINDVPLQMSGQHLRKEKVTSLAFDGAVSSDEATALQLNFLAPHFSGAAKANLALKILPDATRQVEYTLDATPVTLAPLFLTYEKPGQMPAQITGRVVTDAQKKITAWSSEYRAGEDHVQFDLSAAAGALTSLNVPVFRLGDSYNLVVRSSKEPQGLSVKVQSDRFDISKIINRTPAQSDKQSDTQSEKKSGEQAREQSETLGGKRTLKRSGTQKSMNLPAWPANYEFDVRGKNIAGAHEVAFPVIHVSGLGRQGLLEKMVASANFEDGSELYGEIFRDTDTTRRFLLQSENVDDLLRGIGLTESLEGGALSLSGTLHDTPLTEGKRVRSMEGSYAVSSFTVRKVPILAQLLTLASFSGLRDTLTGKGIRFDGAKGNFSYYNQRLDLTEGLLVGSSLGISVQGAIDRQVHRLSLGGTLVPAYGLNSAIGKVPLLGRLLAGREGEGVVGVSYRVFGDTDAPSVIVNPLSVFTPGFIRQLFDLGTGNISRKE